MIDAERLHRRIQALGEIGRTSEGGVTRVALSKEDRRAQALVRSWMEQAGMHVRLDAVGNLIGRKDGLDSQARPVVIGSHIDSVVNGGKFDGTIGVIGGIEVVQNLVDEGVETTRPIEVIAFCEEEGSRFHSALFGSRAMVGQIKPSDLDMADSEGITRRQALQALQDLEAAHALSGQALQAFNVDADEVLDKAIRKAIRRKGEIEVYLEMHIEQGPVLEAKGIPVGIVMGIAGPAWYEVTVEGKAGHAGTIPMGMRHDALLGASELVLELEKICLEFKGTPAVGTVGRMDVLPGGTNIVPGRVMFSVDLRDIDLARRETVLSRITVFAEGVAKKRDLRIEFAQKMSVDPVLCDSKVVQVMRDEADKMGLPTIEMTSGAGHDAQMMASITDIGMIFVRCKDGISHNPEEFADIEDIAKGTRLLSQVVMRHAME